MKTIILTIFILLFQLNSHSQSSSISNIQVSQGIGENERIVNIIFDLYGNYQEYNIELQVSFDNGVTFTSIDPVEVSGSLTVNPGNNIFLAWDGRISYPDLSTDAAQIKIVATSIWQCSDPLTVNHIAGNVAPVTKSVTYGTITNIPGEASKCWITSNLGADHQATARNDATEPSAGWYWQFNRMQGYKHDGTTRTPNTTWITTINENSNWTSANDPCTIELGNSWRLPTSAEYINIDAVGGWSDWNGPWNSALKMHAAGYLNYPNGIRTSFGSAGQYWSSTKGSNVSGYYLDFANNHSNVNNINAQKSYGFSVRCIKE